jgi:ribosomal protein S18 acetylase RimI-like enzyme
MLLRPAEPEDALAVARVHVRSWRGAYRTLLPDDYLDQLRPEDRAGKYDFKNSDPAKPYTIVAAEGGSICGFASSRRSNDGDVAGLGELCALYVDPQCWGRGIGAALVAAARARLVELGVRNGFLWVLKGNVRADRFYRNDGWSLDGYSRTDTVWGVMVDEIRYRRELE